jgi:hypothetical protein
MPPKHRQLRAPRPNASRNAFQALVDPPNDGKNLSFDGGDERTDGSDDNTVVNAFPCISGLPASPQHPQTLTPALRQCLFELGMASQRNWAKIAKDIHILNKQLEHNWANMEIMLSTAYDHNACYFDMLNSKMDSLLQKMDEA